MTIDFQDVSSGDPDPILARIAGQIAAKRAKYPAAFEALTQADIDSYVREETRAKFGYDDIAPMLFPSAAQDRTPSPTPQHPAAGLHDASLIKAARGLATARLNAKDQRVELTPEDQEAFIREETGNRFGLHDAAYYLSSIDANVTPRNMARSFSQGALANWGDEIMGKLPTWLGGGDAAREDLRAREEAFSRTHPVANVVAGIGGAVAGGLLAPVGEAATVTGAVARGAATGVTSGLLAGAGAGVDKASRLHGAATGAVVGGLLGGAIPGAIGTVRALRNPAARAAARLSQAVEQSGGVDEVRQAAAKLAAAGRGNDAMLADITPHLRQAADFAANNNDDVLIPLAERVRARQTDASDRLLGDVRTSFGGDADAGARQTELESFRRAWASNAYDGLRDAGKDLDTGPLAAAFNKPALQGAWSHARLAGDLDEGSPLDALIARIAKSNPGVPLNVIEDAAKKGLFGNAVATSAKARPVTFDDLHQMRRVLDDKVSSSFRQGNGALGQSYKTIRDEIDNALEAQVPGVKAVNTEYARRMGLEHALAAGQDAWGIADSRGLTKHVAALSPEQLVEFRTGMASKLLSQLRSTATNRDEATRLLNSSPAMSDKLRVVFNDQLTFSRFMQRVGAEAELAKMKGAIGGSQTARRLASAGFDPAALGLSAVTGGPAGFAHRALHVLAAHTTGATQRRTAGAMGPMLMTQGVPRINSLLSTLAERAPLVGLLGTRALPAVAGRLPSLLNP
jgi:hypothetical protein